MEFEVPQVISNIKEITAVYNMNDKIDLTQLTAALEDDLLTFTATLRGIKRREQEYGITPKDTDTLEDRRYRIFLEEMKTLPYTEMSLRKKLDAVCGVGNYKLIISKDSVNLKVGLARKSMFEDLTDLLEKVTPLNMLLEVKLLYNTYEKIETYTYEQLAVYTYGQVREEVLI